MGFALGLTALRRVLAFYALTDPQLLLLSFSILLAWQIQLGRSSMWFTLRAMLVM